MALNAGSIEIKLFADLARLQSDMNKANKTVDGAMRNIDKSVGLARRAFGTLSASFGAFQLIKLADDYKRFDSQLQLATKNLNTYTQAYENVIRISRVAQSDITAVGVLYSRLNNNLRDFNVTQAQVAGVTETIALALRTNNATVQETNSVMLQLSQSFGSGKLNGQEFLAVAEGAPMLLRQLANSMKVPFGALKDLSAQGKITREELLKAWTDPEYLAALQNQVKQVGTISSAMTVFTNNLKVFVGEQDKATGISSAFTKIIMLLADNINVLAGGGLVLLSASIGKFTAGVWANITAISARNAALVSEAAILARSTAAEAAKASAVASTTTYMLRNTGATVAATTAAGSLRVAIAALGGPIGAVTTLLGLGVTAWLAWGNQGVASATQVSEALARVDKGLSSINDAKLIKMQRAALEAQRASLVESERRAGMTGARAALSSEQRNKTNLEYLMQLEDYDRKIAELDAGLEKHNQIQKENINVITEGGKAYERLAKANKLLSVEIAEQKTLIEDAKKALTEGIIKQADYNYVVDNANAKIKQLTENKHKLTLAEKEEYKMAAELAKVNADLLTSARDLAALDQSSIQVFEQKKNAISELDSATRQYVETQIELAKIAEFEKIQSEGIAREAEYAGELYDAQKEADDKRYESYVELAEKMKRENEDLNISIIGNDKKRAEAQNEIEHQRALEKINSMMLEGEYTQDLIELENKRYELQKKQLIGTKSITRELGLTFTSAFEDAVVSGKKLSDVLNSLAQDMVKLVARKMVTEPMANAVSGILGDIFPSFGGAYANGGRPPVGVPSLVGERGPELFVPNTAGTIIPNNQLSTGSTNNVSVVVNVSQSGSDVQSNESIGKNLGNAIKNAVQAELIKQKRQGGLLA